MKGGWAGLGTLHATGGHLGDQARDWSPLWDPAVRAANSDHFADEFQPNDLADQADLGDQADLPDLVEKVKNT